MSKITRGGWCWLASLLVTGTAVGQFDFQPEQEASFGDSRDRVRVEVKAGASEVARGGDLPVAVVFEIDPRWHIWTNDRPLPDRYATFDFAIMTKIQVESSSPSLFAHPGFLAWPEFHGVQADIGDGPSEYAVFEGRAVAYLPVTVPLDAALGPAALTLTVDFQACDDRTCMAPAQQSLELSIEVVDSPSAHRGDPDADLAGFPFDLFRQIRAGEKPPDIVDFDLFGLVSFELDAASKGGLLLLLLIAAVGGFLLNLTPCVLPMIPIKIIGLSQAASGSRRRTLVLGLAMSVGIIGFWLVLGTLIAAVSGFSSTNQLFQYPAFTIGVGLFIALMAVGMCGMFSIRLPQSVYLINPSHETIYGSIVFGILAAVLSTPCTAPFMGAAAAWAATKTPGVVLSAFAAIGTGMAFPYLILSAFPVLVERMPRTGPASELIKQVMGLLMLAAAAYFVGVGVSGALVSPPSPPSRAYWWFVGLFGAAAGAWLAYRTVRITPSLARRIGFGGIGIAILILSGAIAVRASDQGPIDWVYYTPQRFAEAKAKGNVVVMEFTAEWCLNCKALEESVLRNPRIASLLGEDGVVPIKVDLTGNNEAGNEMLNMVNRLTIPLLVIFRPDGTEAFKGDFYTVDQVITAVEQARESKLAAGGSDR